ncbi:MAG: hypothetical protein SOU07_01330 [Bacilli bacterium]|nr:hypothetical protein [Acholeplasmataceae bacterium]MDY2902072.1 hypothetical protein [Bacilli bacterium]
MKKCHTEIMKEIKKLEEVKETLLNEESDNCIVTYLQKETPINTGYDYNLTNIKIEECDTEILRLKSLLTKANVETNVEGFEMTISEALVYLAQLNEKLKRLSYLVNLKPLKRSTGYDSVPEFTKIVFDREKVLKDYEEVRNLIPKLQMAIDRTNLNHMIEC